MGDTVGLNLNRDLSLNLIGPFQCPFLSFSFISLNDNVIVWNCINFQESPSIGDWDASEMTSDNYKMYRIER